MSLPQTYKALAGPLDGSGPKIIELPVPKPDKDQVLIKMEYVPINPSDLVTMKGIKLTHSTEPHLVGYEGSGVVVALGEDLKLSHKIGDRVHVAGLGTYGEYFLTNSENVSPIQGNLSLEEAASHYINPGTVYLFGELAEKGGHKAVIQNVAASSLGKMVIRYFKQKGIKLINIVRRDENVELLKKEEGAEYVLNQNAPDFEERLKELAEKLQATMALDPVGEGFSEKLFGLLPPNSTLYIYATMGGFALKNVNIMEFFRNKTIAGFIIFNNQAEFLKNGELPKFYNEVHSLLPTVFKSEIVKVFKLAELEQAIKYYNENSSRGKVLIKLS